MIAKGTKFGDLVVQSGPHNSPRGTYVSWDCLCKLCGCSIRIPEDSLYHTTNCGCRHHAFKHGETGTPTFLVWSDMVRRCTSPTHPKYNRYGGNDVKVCARWGEYLNFKKDMGEKPEGAKLHRKNGVGDYKPSNCEWSNSSVTMKTRNYCLKYTVDGKVCALTDIAEMFGVKYQALYRKVRTLDIPIARALVELGVILGNKQIT